MSETPLPEVQAQRDDTLTPRAVRAWNENIGWATDIDVAPDGTVVIGTTSQEVVFARLDSPRLESIPRAGATVAVSPDVRFLATAFEEGSRLRDYASGKLLHRYEGEQLALVSDGEQVVSAGPDQQLRLWQARGRADTTRGAP